MLHEESLTKEIIGAAIEVHRVLGAGLLESAYEQCICHELALRDILFRRQVELPVSFKGMQLACGYRIDLLVDERVVVELKSVDEIHDLHKAQLLTYLKLSRLNVGMILNFNVPLMKDGIVRMAL